MSIELFCLKDKVILITGAAGGIGSAIAESFAAAGAKVVITDCDLNRAVMFAQSLNDSYDLLPLELRVEKLDQCIEVVNKTVQCFGTIDVLINAAGVNTRMRPEEYDESTWEQIIKINLGGTFNMCQAVFSIMKERGGKVINIGSILSLMANEMTAPYAASKGGVLQLTRSLACAWAKNQINVNAILPGWIDTPLSRQARQDIKGHAERVVETTPLKRWGEPKDIVGSAFFLASSASDFVTGTSLVVDGGVTAHV